MHADPTGRTSDASRQSGPREADPFAELVRGIRAGDARAASELVRQHESAIRLEVRLRLRNSRLRRVLDSMDICQSVLASFFVRAAAGQYDLDEPAQLLRLLVTIARNKVADQARKERAQRRDNRRIDDVDPGELQLTAAGHSPSQLVAGTELLQELRRRLSAEERLLADLRAQGWGWAEIAAEVGGTPEARRMQLTRAVERVARQLGLEGMRHG
jgi:RNA polymerase sigma-70 factor (ECF subfamily)